MGLNSINEKDRLLNLSMLGDLGYNCIGDMYNVDMLKQSIDKFDENDDFDDSFLDYDDIMLDAYRCYLNDINSIDNRTSLENNKLFNDILVIIQKLNILFDKANNLDYSENEKNILWLGDKYNYFVSNCSDVELLDDIKKLYDEYVIKRNLYLETNLKFVIMIAKKIWNSECFLELEDLIQYGNIGLIRAIEVYDSSKDVEFLTYAGYWVKHSIIYNSKKVMHPVRLPVNWYATRNKWVKAIEFLVHNLGRYPSFLEIAKHVEMEPDKLGVIIDAFSMCISLDMLLEDNLNEITEGFVDPYFCDKFSFLIDDTFSIDKDIEYEEMSLELDYYMDLYLSDREKFILKSKYGFIERKDVAELASMYGISESRLYNIMKNSYVKLLKHKDFRKMRVYLR